MAKPDDPTAAAPSTAAAGEGLAVGRQTPLELEYWQIEKV